MLVKGLDLGGVVAREEIETLRGAAVEKGWETPCYALGGCQCLLDRDTGGSGGNAHRYRSHRRRRCCRGRSPTFRTGLV